MCVWLQLSFTGAAWPSSEHQNAPLSHLYFSILRVFCNNLNFLNMHRHHSTLYSLVKFHQGAGVTRVLTAWNAIHVVPAAAIFCNTGALLFSLKVSSARTVFLNSWLLEALKGFQWVTFQTLTLSRSVQPGVRQSKSLLAHWSMCYLGNKNQNTPER